MVPTLYIARTADGAGLPLPSYTSAHHMGLNLQAAVSSPVRLNAGERVYIPIGFAIGIPDGYCGQVVSQPTLARQEGIIVLDAPQLLNPADREPLFVLLQNTSQKAIVIHRGLVCAQLLIVPVVQVSWHEITHQSSDQQVTPAESMLLDEMGQKTPESEHHIVRRKAHPIRNRFGGDDEE